LNTLINISILLGCLLLLIFSISKWKIHPFIALILTALLLGISFGLGGTHTIEVLLIGFSETLRWIAIIIILGAFIGEVLQETGGAFRISDTIVKKVGGKQLPWAMGVTGYVISIPVFVDVAYILLQPVTESLSVKSKKPVLYIGLSLAAGLTVAHTLIPPTPGPMAVASMLNTDMGKMLLCNLFVACCALVGGIIWVIFSVKDSWIAYDKKLEEKLKIKGKDLPNRKILKPNLLLDLLPIVAPILLIASGAFLDLEENITMGRFFDFISMPLVAVSIGAFIAIFQLKNEDRKSRTNKLVEQAIVKSALVIMITGAGGALGYVIRETGIQGELVSMFSELPLFGILLPFIVAAILTISTGSITVSLVGTASMLGPMVNTLPISPEMVAALIGSGSFCVFHANASFFWLLNRLHEVPPDILYKKFTLQSLVMGLSGLLGTLLLIMLGL